jgi:molybdopterin converting factor small subunit
MFPGVGVPSVRVRLYASAREAARRPTVDVPVPVGGVSARELVRLLAAESPELAPVLRISRLVRNDAYLGNLRARIRPGDEVAVHPPYTGG